MIALPDDVTDWLRGVFRTCNAAASSKLSAVPNAHEPWIDFAIIESLQRVSAPYAFRSDWIVSIDTHWLGSGRLWPEDFPRWEIADIGFLVMFRTGTKLMRSKIALLQCKRLYAEAARPETEEEVRRYYGRGFGRMMTPDDEFEEMTKPKLFRFGTESSYSALTKGSSQWSAIDQYEESKQVPVYYLLYNPPKVPCDVAVPHPAGKRSSDDLVTGCRIVPARHMHRLLASQENGASPTFGDVRDHLGSPFDRDPHRGGWMLEYFVVDLLLQCKTGRVMDIRDDRSLYQVFYRRTAPIQAAISITIDAPAGFEWDVEPTPER